MPETVEFVSVSGTKLVASLQSPEGVTQPPAVVLVHGWGLDRANGELRKLAEALGRSGLAVLAPDLTGHGESGGSAETATLEDHRADVRTAIDWLRDRGDYGAIGVYGMGSGAAVAIAEAASDDRVAALVLHAPSAHARRDQAARVDAPTLLLDDEGDGISDRHRVLADSFHGEHRFAIVPAESQQLGAATPLTILAQRTAKWFRGWLGAQPRVSGGFRAPEALPAAEAQAAEAQAAETVAGRALFADRSSAGAELAKQLGDHIGVQTLVLALPRGGMAVAEPIADVLGADLDVLVVRKIRAPFQPELGLGAVAEDSAVEWNEPLLRELGHGEAVRRRELERAHRQLADHVAIYRSAAPRAPIEDRVVILVDDGVATGGTVRAAIDAIRRGKPKKMVVAIPAGAPDVLGQIAALTVVDELVALERTDDYHAVGDLYRDYPAVTTDEVCDALRRAHARRRQLLQSR